MQLDFLASAFRIVFQIAPVLFLLAQICSLEYSISALRRIDFTSFFQVSENLLVIYGSSPPRYSVQRVPCLHGILNIVSDEWIRLAF